MLMRAVAWSQNRVVEILLANNADMTVRDNKGRTAMDIAVEEGGRTDYTDIIGMLEQEEARRRGQCFNMHDVFVTRIYHSVSIHYLCNPHSAHTFQTCK